MTRLLPVRIGPVDTATRLAALPAGQHGGPDAAVRRDQLLLRQALITHRRVCIAPEARADYDTRADHALARLDAPTVTAETTETPRTPASPQAFAGQHEPCRLLSPSRVRRR